jgi:hypothetical protein
MTAGPHNPLHAARRRELILMPMARPEYPPHLTLDERRLRMLMEWESIEALKLTRAAGLETPCARQTT